MKYKYISDNGWLTKDNVYECTKTSCGTGYHIFVEEFNSYLRIDNQSFHMLFSQVIENTIQPTEIKCECGGTKLGYKPGRMHSTWCKLYKE